MTTQWQNRIVRYGTQAADQFTAHPNNPRRHPMEQREAVKGSLDTLGWIAPCVINARTGYLVDGHERVMQALGQGDNTPVPYIEVDLSEEEEALALASFDWITQMAYYDRDSLDTLLQGIDTDNEALQVLLSDLAEKQGVIPPTDDAWDAAMGNIPDGDKSSFQEMVFTLHDLQVPCVKDAIALAQSKGPFNAINENSNGNALARICEAYLNGR